MMWTMLAILLFLPGIFFVNCLISLLFNLAILFLVVIRYDWRWYVFGGVPHHIYNNLAQLESKCGGKFTITLIEKINDIVVFHYRSSDGKYSGSFKSESRWSHILALIELLITASLGMAMEVMRFILNSATGVFRR